MSPRTETLPRERDIQLRTNFWVVPLVMAGLAAAAAVASVAVDHALRGHLDHVPTPLRLSPDDAKTLLATLTGASITVVGLVVSLTMVVLSLVATNFGPRIIRNFIRRRSTQLVIGAFVATFVFSLLVLVAVSSGEGSVFVPLVSAWVAVVLVLGSTALLVAWVHDLAFSIQTGNTLVSIAADFHAALGRQRTVLGGLRAAEPVDVATPHPVPAGASGYVQRIDASRLLRVAERADVLLRVAAKPGGWALTGTPLAWSSRPLTTAQAVAVARAVTLGAYRTMEQDLEYALAQYVEIALRALSPAVNDPFTAESCIDWLGDALVRLAAAATEPRAVADEQGTVRLLVTPTTYAHAVARAFDQIRQAAADQPAIAIRLLRTIARLAPSAPDDAARDALRGQALAVVARAGRAVMDPGDAADVSRAAEATVAALDRR